jgi:hypothetical protein
MKKLLLVLVSIIMMVMMQPVWAVHVRTLYQTVVPISAQTQAARDAAVQLGLQKVLIKITGNRDVNNNPFIKAHLNTANTLLQEFSYIAAKKEDAQPYQLQINFDAKAVNQLLQQAALPIWSQNRPLILGWLVIDSPNQPAVVIESDAINPLAQIFKQAADNRGVPVLLPMMDMTDLTHMTADDITQMNVANLTQAAMRYKSDGMLITRFSNTANGVSAQAKLILGKEHWDWNVAGKTLADVAGIVIDNVADTLSNRYAVVLTNTVTSQISIKVTNVKSMTDFDNLVLFLQNLAPIQSVVPVTIQGTNVILQIKLRSTLAAFNQAVLVSAKLTPVSNSPASLATSAIVYQWNN